MRGAGASSKPRGPKAYDFERLADDLAAVLRATTPGHAAHLVGHDWGGIQGWEFATDPRFAGRLASFTTIAGPSLDQVMAGNRRALAHGRLLAWLGRMRRSWYILPMWLPGGPTLIWRAVLSRPRWASWLRAVERVPVGDGYPADTIVEDGLHGANLYRRNIPTRVLRPRRPASAHVPVQLVIPSGDRFISPDYYDQAERARPRPAPANGGGVALGPACAARAARPVDRRVRRRRRGRARADRRDPVAPRRRRRADATAGWRSSPAPAAGSVGPAAHALARHGARLLLVDRDADTVRRAAESIAGAAWFTCDVSDPEAMERLAARP